MMQQIIPAIIKTFSGAGAASTFFDETIINLPHTYRIYSVLENNDTIKGTDSNHERIPSK